MENYNLTSPELDLRGFRFDDFFQDLLALLCKTLYIVSVLAFNSVAFVLMRSSKIIATKSLV